MAYFQTPIAIDIRPDFNASITAVFAIEIFYPNTLLPDEILL